MAGPSQLNAILERLALIQQGIAGIVNAYAYLPADPSVMEVPFFINEPVKGLGNEANFWAAGGPYRVENNIEVWLCVNAWQLEVTQAMNLQACYNWRDLWFTTLAQHTCLSQVAGTRDLTYILDAKIVKWGVDRHTVGSTDYAAIGYLTRVREGLAVVVTA